MSSHLWWFHEVRRLYYISVSQSVFFLVYQLNWCNCWSVLLEIERIEFTPDACYVWQCFMMDAHSMFTQHFIRYWYIYIPADWCFIFTLFNVNQHHFLLNPFTSNLIQFCSILSIHFNLDVDFFLRIRFLVETLRKTVFIDTYGVWCTLS